MGEIFCITFKNGKKFVGITANSAEKRIAALRQIAALSDAARYCEGSRTPLSSAFQRYKNNYTLTTIIESDDISLLEEQLIDEIYKNESYYPFGYNIESIQKLHARRKRDLKKKLSEQMKEKWKDPEFRARIPASVKKALKGIPLTEEHKKRISSTKKKQWKDPKFKAKQMPLLLAKTKLAAEKNKLLWQDPVWRKNILEKQRAGRRK